MKGLIGYKMVEIQQKHFNYPVNPFIFERVKIINNKNVIYATNCFFPCILYSFCDILMYMDNLTKI